MSERHVFNARFPQDLWARLQLEKPKGVSMNDYIVSQLGGRERCDHQPFRDAGHRFCYRCGAPL